VHNAASAPPPVGSAASATLAGAPSHLSFSFRYFIHGESSVCASVDVRQHPPVRRLSLQHLAVARGQSTPVQVMVAPFGVSGTLTGVSYRRTEADPAVERHLRDWRNFYASAPESQYCQSATGGAELVPMPAAVEVLVAGVKMTFPTSFVLITDMDPHDFNLAPADRSVEARTLQTCSSATGAKDGPPRFQVEPSSFTASNHPLLETFAHSSFPAGATNLHLQELNSQSELVWQDALCINPEAQQQQAANEEQQPGGGSQILEYLSHWDFCNPSRLSKGATVRRGGRRQRDAGGRTRDARTRFTSRIPFHRKPETIDELAWHLDHTHLSICQGSSPLSMGSGGRSERMPGSVQGTAGSVNPASMGPPGSVKNEREASALGTSHSPASIGTPMSVMTPKAPAPGSVRTPGDSASLSLASPHQPLSNGPLTPADTSAPASVSAAEQKPPRTPKSVPPTSYSVTSPYTSVKPVERKSELKMEADDSDGTQAVNKSFKAEAKGEPGNSHVQVVPPSFFKKQVKNEEEPASLPLSLPCKRPGLPGREYDGDRIGSGPPPDLSDIAYDYQGVYHWLNHPVKRFRPTLPPGAEEQPMKPIYRRNSQTLNNCDNSSSEPSTFPVLATRLAAVGEEERPSAPSSAKTAFPSIDDGRKANQSLVNGAPEPPRSAGFSVEHRPSLTNGGSYMDVDDPFEYIEPGSGVNGSNDKRTEEEKREDYFTAKGLRPHFSDLDNLFDDSGDEQDPAAVAAPTPPDSNKPLDAHGEEGGYDDKGATILSSAKMTNGAFKKMEAMAGNVPHDQLSTMFPTPPSVDGAHLDEGVADEGHTPQGGPVTIKGEPIASIPGNEDAFASGMDLMDWTLTTEERAAFMTGSDIFAPLSRLYSDEFPPIKMTETLTYKARLRSTQAR